jgi:hypothetical protein
MRNEFKIIAMDPKHPVHEFALLSWFHEELVEYHEAISDEDRLSEFLDAIGLLSLMEDSKMRENFHRLTWVIHLRGLPLRLNEATISSWLKKREGRKAIFNSIEMRGIIIKLMFVTGLKLIKLNY